MTPRRVARARTAPARPYERASEPVPAEIAAYQNVARGWLLMWSPWRRTWTAIACFGAAPVIIDHPDPLELLRQCRAAELSAAQGGER